MRTFQFRIPGTIIAEPGGIARVAEVRTLASLKRVLVVTDRALVELGFVEKVKESFGASGTEVLVFDGVEPEPSAATVRKAAAFGQEHGVEGVVGLGGGSPMDVAKLVALLVAAPQRLEDMYGVDRARGDRLPLALIPTTAGTGSEVTHVSVVTGDNDEKSPVLGPQLLCDTVILDAALTLGLPSEVTAATGIDAMVHAIEAYTSGVRKNPVSDQLALNAVRLLFNNIRTVMENGTDVEARSSMLTGSMLAGLAFANATVGAVHALAYPLGTQFHVPHGASNAVVLVPVMRFNMPVAVVHYAEIARATLPDLTGRSDEEAAGRLVDAIERLIPDVGLASRLRGLGVVSADIEKLSDGAQRQERILSYNIRPVARQNITEIYQEAL